MSFHAPKKYMITHPILGKGEGNNGCFMIRMPGKINRLLCISSDGGDWEHVSVSWPDRCPTWDEMCFIKDMFWDKSDWVVQFHPAETDYVNNHPFCLHLWRPVGGEFPKPDSILVGTK